MNKDSRTPWDSIEKLIFMSVESQKEKKKNQCTQKNLRNCLKFPKFGAKQLNRYKTFGEI